MRYLFIDFETTGLDATKDQVTQVGLVWWDSKVGLSEKRSYYVRLRTGMKIPAEIVDLTGITPTLLREQGISESKVFGVIGYYIGKSDVVVAQHAPFDFSFLAQHNIHPQKFICTRSLSKMIDPTLSSSLKNVYNRLFGMDVPRHHDALWDCIATRHILRVQMVRAEIMDIEYGNTIINDPERPLTFIPRYSNVVPLVKEVSSNDGVASSQTEGS
jgi:DNA polymerase III subunit epsilon